MTELNRVKVSPKEEAIGNEDPIRNVFVQTRNTTHENGFYGNDRERSPSKKSHERKIATPQLVLNCAWAAGGVLSPSFNSSEVVVLILHTPPSVPGQVRCLNSLPYSNTPCSSDFVSIFSCFA